MGIYATKSKWQQGLEPIVELCVRRQIHPDIFTYGALEFSFMASGALLAAGTNRAWLWLVLPCLIARLLLNLMDGQIARALHLADAWGEVKNEFGDRVADAAIFLSLCFGGYADARLGVLAIVLIVCISYLGILNKAVGGARIYSGAFGKGDRMISLAAFTFCALFSGDLSSFNWYLAFASFAASVTIFQRLRMIYVYTHSLH